MALHQPWHSPAPVLQGKGHLTQAERLAATIRRHNIRVLILHGSSDALVPAANSRRLAALLPNAEVRCCAPAPCCQCFLLARRALLLLRLIPLPACFLCAARCF
jgi:pimeloyl-ACP methyl ester carboxylesterase